MVKEPETENDDKWNGGWFSRKRDGGEQVVGSIRGWSRVDYRKGVSIGGSESLVPSIYSASEPVDNG